jgi:uncharacterized RDD family membrane protein YckC
MSAQRDLLPLDEAPAQTEAEAPVALKEQVAQRLAAHRARRSQHLGNPVTPIANSAPANPRASRIAAAVAERYAHSQSYRAFLAAQAEAAIHEAEAAAEVAVLNAQAVADAQHQLLAELDQWNLTPASDSTPSGTKPGTSESLSSPTAPSPHPGLTVWLDDADQISLSHTQPASNRLRSQYALDEAESVALDEEIAFRQSPTFEDVGAPVDIPANLIEFPRQLVAPRKARPRLAEGPLREEADSSTHRSPQTAQLRIFEVEAAQISTAPAVESLAPEWSSILLAAQPVSAVVEVPEAPFQPVFSPQTAPFNLRLMASIVDGCIIMAALLAFTAAFAITVGKLPAGHAANVGHITLQTAGIGAAGTFVVLTLLYQLLFFTFSEATPGMRYAHIALCTFADDNPTRAAMRRRVLATVLAACPLGVGFLWAWLDDDGLGWHDRISRMYQRSY